MLVSNLNSVHYVPKAADLRARVNTICLLKFYGISSLLYEESNFGTILTTTRGNILNSSNKLIIIFIDVLHFYWKNYINCKIKIRAVLGWQHVAL